jgi:opacity protein-like surface antigen
LKESTVLLKWAGTFVLLFLPSLALAQSAESAVGGNSSLWAGTEFSSFNPDYSCSSTEPFGCQNQLFGPAAFFDLNVSPKWGAEGEARWLHWNGDGGQIESSYLAGGRYRVADYHRLNLWLKLLMGGGLITTPGYPAHGSLKGSYFAYAPGGTLEFPLTHRISLRGDYEYQIWPSFAGPPSYDTTTGTVITHAHGLTPNGFSLGVTYRFLGQ